LGLFSNRGFTVFTGACYIANETVIEEREAKHRKRNSRNANTVIRENPNPEKKLDSHRFLHNGSWDRSLDVSPLGSLHTKQKAKRSGEAKPIVSEPPP